MEVTSLVHVIGDISYYNISMPRPLLTTSGDFESCG